MKLKKMSDPKGMSVHWNHNDKADMLLAKGAIKNLLSKGYLYYDIDDPQLSKEKYGTWKEGPPDRYLMCNDHIDMEDFLECVLSGMEYDGNNTLEQIVEFLADLGLSPMLYQVVDKKNQRVFHFSTNRFNATAIGADHCGATQAAIKAILLWDKKGRPV